MKPLYLLPLFLSLSCNCTKSTVADVAKLQQSTLKSDCPEDGTCKLELLKNKRIVANTDTTGKMYFSLEESKTTSVIKYEYQLKVEPGLQDGQHREEIVFEVDNTVSQLALKDKELQQVKMIFGRHCFCRGQAGYFKVHQGTLDLTTNKNGLDFTLDFITNEVPQKISRISGNLK